MLRRVGLRRLLPCLNLVVYVSMIGVCDIWKSGPNPMPTSQIPSAETRDVSVFVKSVLSANVLALAVGVILNGASHTHPMRAFLLAVPFVPLFWYPVGAWLDRRLGWRSRSRPTRSLVRDILLIVVAVIALLPFVVLIQVIKAGVPSPPDRLGMGFGLCAWITFGLVVILFALFNRFYHRHPVTSTNT